MAISGAVDWRAGDLEHCMPQGCSVLEPLPERDTNPCSVLLVAVSAVVHSHLLLERRQERWRSKGGSMVCCALGVKKPLNSTLTP